MHATFRQLQLFAALAETGSVTGAAKACHVTQPTVSMQLKELASSVGLPLVDLAGRRLRLTDAGESLLRTAHAMSRAWAAFEQDVAGFKGHTRGRLRLAVVSTAEYFVPRMLGNFCAERPGIDVTLQVLNREGVLARLRADLDDLYIMSMPPKDADVERRVFMPNPLVVIAPRDHPLAAARRAVPLTTLAEAPFILREPGSGTRMACAAHFESLGFRPHVRLELGSNEAIKQAVAAGLGLAVLSRHAIEHGAGDDRLKVLRVRGFPAQSSWYLLHSRARRLSPVASEFLERAAAARSPLAKDSRPKLAKA